MTTEPYLDRRRRLMRTHEDGLTLVRGGGPEGVNPNFFYLTGIAEPSAALLLAPDGVRVGTGRRNPGPDYVNGRVAHQILFLPPTNPLAVRWGEDCSATLDNADPRQLGVDDILSTSEMDEVLTAWLGRASAVRLVRGFPASLSGEADADTAFAERIRNRFFGLQVLDATPVVHEMRRLKDHGEHEAIKRSIDVTQQALDAVVGRLTDGLLEHELEAEIARVYRSHGGTHAFEPIVGCGANALKLHYTRNDGPVQHGKLLLIDTGVSIQGYKSDITRTFPVGGEFTQRQREVYEVVLRAQDEAIAMCRPGVLIGDIHARSFEVIAKAGYDGADYPHGIGHHLGLETHDVGDVHLPLEAGAVVTIEPGIYVSGDDIGVRIEDDVLITEDGPRVLSAAIPKTVEDVERWVSQKRT
jgi:Xaa-Pro aminopeptidase